MGIQTALFESPLGTLIIKVSEANLHAVLFTNSLKRPLTAENTSVESHHSHVLMDECKKQLEEYFAGKRLQFDLPVQQEGTPFQQSVWAALLTIPYGRTISYLELSKRIGNVKATRAVGTTNGSNQVSIIVPCHRVIGSNGDLTGYGGDLWRKKWLLEHEDKFANGVQTLF
ncbi:MAG: methylated-DNA--[protein]-cysteine S-methyltransferase [Ferruginibacter sp.]